MDADSVTNVIVCTYFVKITKPLTLCEPWHKIIKPCLAFFKCHKIASPSKTRPNLFFFFAMPFTANAALHVPCSKLIKQKNTYDANWNFPNVTTSALNVLLTPKLTRKSAVTSIMQPFLIDTDHSGTWRAPCNRVCSVQFKQILACKCLQAW